MKSVLDSIGLAKHYLVAHISAVYKGSDEIGLSDDEYL